MIPRKLYIRLKARPSWLGTFGLRLVKPFVAAIVTTTAADAQAVRDATGGTGAPVLIRIEDEQGGVSKDGIRSPLPARLGNSPVLILSPDMKDMGGIGRYDWAWTEAAVDLGHPVRVVAVWRWGLIPAKSVEFWRRAAFTLKSVLTALIRRPKAVIATHPGLAPVAMFASRLSGAKYAVALHGSDAWREFAKPQEKAIRRADLRIPVSHFTRDFVARSLGMAASDFYVMGSIVAPAIEAAADRPSGVEPVGERGGPSILTVSRLDESTPHKGHTLVVKALPRLRDDFPTLRYVVVGDGIYRESLERLADEEGVTDMVEFRGRVSDEELAEAYRRAEVFVMPSVVSFDPPEGEGFGLVYLEAGAFGVPSIAARSGGATETVLDGVTGLLVEPDSLEQLVSAIRSLLADESLRRRLGAGAILRSREFSYTKFRRRCRAVLECLVSGRDPSDIEPEYPRHSLRAAEGQTEDTAGNAGLATASAPDPPAESATPAAVPDTGTGTL